MTLTEAMTPTGHPQSIWTKYRGADIVIQRLGGLNRKSALLAYRITGILGVYVISEGFRTIWGRR